MRYVPLQQFMPVIQQMMDEGTTYPSMRQSLMDSDTGSIAEFKHLEYDYSEEDAAHSRDCRKQKTF